MLSRVFVDELVFSVQVETAKTISMTVESSVGTSQILIISELAFGFIGFVYRNIEIIC